MIVTQPLLNGVDKGNGPMMKRHRIKIIKPNIPIIFLWNVCLKHKKPPTSKTIVYFFSSVIFSKVMWLLCVAFGVTNALIRNVCFEKRKN